MCAHEHKNDSTSSAVFVSFAVSPPVPNEPLAMQPNQQKWFSALRQQVQQPQNQGPPPPPPHPDDFRPRPSVTPGVAVQVRYAAGLMTMSGGAYVSGMGVQVSVSQGGVPATGGIAPGGYGAPTQQYAGMLVHTGGIAPGGTSVPAPYGGGMQVAGGIALGMVQPGFSGQVHPSAMPGPGAPHLGSVLLPSAPRATGAYQGPAVDDYGLMMPRPSARPVVPPLEMHHLPIPPQMPAPPVQAPIGMRPTQAIRPTMAEQTPLAPAAEGIAPGAPGGAVVQMPVVLPLFYGLNTIDGKETSGPPCLQD